jgi:proteic killer suppression protein
MRYRFESPALRELFENGVGAERYPEGVVRKFFQRVDAIRAARSEQDLRGLKSLHFEKLQNDFYSIRLNKGWRLELKLEMDDQGKLLVIIRISNHYKP